MECKILRQARAERIPVDKLVRAVVQRGVPEETTRAYLAGEIGHPHLHWTVGDEFFLAISDITWAMDYEAVQIADTRRRWLVAPRHPGVPGRENRVLGLSRERFLELCKLSQPALVRRALKAKRRRARRRPRLGTAPRRSPGDAPRASSS